MDNDTFNNNTFDDDAIPSSFAGLIAQEVIYTIFAVTGVILNVASIYTINRFKQLKTVPNLLFSNWAIADSLSLLITPSTFRLLLMIDNFDLHPKYQCAILEADLIFHNVAILLMIIISFDWCFATYFPNVLKRVRQCCKFVILVMWGFAFFFVIITVRLCIRKIRHWTTVLVLISLYLLLLLCTIVNQISRCVQKCRKIDSRHSTLMLNISSTYTICWFPGFIFYSFVDLFHIHPLLAFVTESPIFCCTIINFVIMYKGNHEFQACLRQLLKHSRERYTENIRELETRGSDNETSSIH